MLVSSSLSAAQPTRTLKRATLKRVRDLTVFLALLQVGFAMPSPSPMTRWHLLHRFTLTGSKPAVCSLWHFPAGHPGWALPTTLLYGARTFLDNSPLRDHPDGSSDR
ncbi:hypothetical protein JCM18918_1555 [Cutibacterium acnes JCM 18918]|nr:hypothetical protein JCM18918_1555 [Cutibacterium acnes JCM 18918]